MKRRAVVVSGGTLDYDVVIGQLLPHDFIIGVDKGVEFLDASGMIPDYIVGDFDSVDLEILEKYKAKKAIPIREFNPVKDASDTEIAVRLGIELGYEQLLILGATGSRLDHVWANIQVLAIPFATKVEAAIIDGVNRIRLIPKQMIMEKKEAYGPYFSVFPLGGSVEGLTIKGAKYPLERHKLEPYDSLSVSNQFLDETLSITYDSGLLIFMESKEA